MEILTGVVVVVLVLFLFLMILGILWSKGYIGGKMSREKGNQNTYLLMQNLDRIFFFFFLIFPKYCMNLEQYTAMPLGPIYTCSLFVFIIASLFLVEKLAIQSTILKGTIYLLDCSAYKAILRIIIAFLEISMLHKLQKFGSS